MVVFLGGGGKKKGGVETSGNISLPVCRIRNVGLQARNMWVLVRCLYDLPIGTSGHFSFMVFFECVTTLKAFKLKMVNCIKSILIFFPYEDLVCVILKFLPTSNIYGSDK